MNERNGKKNCAGNWWLRKASMLTTLRCYTLVHLYNQQTNWEIVQVPRWIKLNPLETVWGATSFGRWQKRWVETRRSSLGGNTHGRSAERRERFQRLVWCGHSVEDEPPDLQTLFWPCKSHLARVRQLCRRREWQWQRWLFPASQNPAHLTFESVSTSSLLWQLCGKMWRHQDDWCSWERGLVGGQGNFGVGGLYGGKTAGRPSLELFWNVF